MEKEFIVRPKDNSKKTDKSVVMTIRMDRDLQEKYDKLSTQSGHSRNELMCMALQYALDNLKFISNAENSKDEGNPTEDVTTPNRI